jgi:hypothetical protein
MIILNDDIISKILDYRFSDIDKEIDLLIFNLNKIKNIIKPLNIIKYFDNSYIIYYDYIKFSINKYLFDIAIKGKVFIVYPGFIYDHNYDFLSDLLINPTYFTLLKEANNTYYKYKAFYNNRIINLLDIRSFDEYKCKLYRIMLNNDITYIELILD